MTAAAPLTRKLETLASHFKTLPETLPKSMETWVGFTIDPEELVDLRAAGALNQVFHRMWGYKKDGLRISE